jgi:geranylgeranyl pyrophosphate synthase
MLGESMESKKAQEALRYYARKWQDTTRPGVLSFACEAVGGSPDEVVPLQTALLFIAATMDIHDDIIDKSTAKSTGKTVYGKFGEETALLLGNAFLVKGFNCLYRAVEDLSHDRKLSIMDTAKDFLFEVINAHITEVELRNKKWNVKAEAYLHVLEQKAADVEGHMRIGSIFGGGSSRETAALSRYGRNLGVLLAVRSDFIDVFEPRELTNRASKECLPLPVLYALQDENHRKKTREILSKESIDQNDANRLVEIVYHTSGITRLRRYLDRLRKEALTALYVFSDSEVRSNLSLLVSSMLEDL